MELLKDLPLVKCTILVVILLRGKSFAIDKDIYWVFKVLFFVELGNI